MNSEPLISFIIPYYNSGNTIEETIESIIKQNYNNYDIWIVNDGSNDDFSIHKLNKFKTNNKISILHQKNLGPSIARNKAIKKSKAEYIVPLDADDLISKNAIKQALPFLQNNSEVGVVYGDLLLFEKSLLRKNQETFDIKKQLLWNQIAVCAIIKKEVFETVGYYDEFLSKLGLEDWEFWIRVSTGWKFKKINDIFFNIRVHNDSRTFQIANKNLDKIKEYVYRKHASLVAKIYNIIFYEKKMLKETPDYRIGNILMKPYRFIKQFFKNEL